MDELALEAVTHHNEGSQLSGENLAVEIEPLNFRPPRVELPDGRLRVLPLCQVVQLAECLVELTLFRASINLTSSIFDSLLYKLQSAFFERDALAEPPFSGVPG